MIPHRVHTGLSVGTGTSSGHGSGPLGGLGGFGDRPRSGASQSALAARSTPTHEAALTTDPRPSGWGRTRD
jgi:hypothetical protein